MASSSDTSQTPGTGPSGVPPLDNELARAVKTSAQEIWLAGMGAFAKAQEEGQRVFETLVKEGTHLQQKTQSAAEQQLGELSGKVTAMATEATEKASASWDKLESLFETRTAKALQHLGVPTAAELVELRQQVAALQAQVQALSDRLAANQPKD